MIKGDYLRALDKISDNLGLIKSNNKELRNFLTHIGSKRDSKAFNDQMNHTLQVNGDLFTETTQLINDFKSFAFPNSKDKMTNIRQLKMMESNNSQLKQEFDGITYKITRQNKSIIDSSRNSRISLAVGKEDNKQMQLIYGEDMLFEEKLKDKEKQINIISK